MHALSWVWKVLRRKLLVGIEDFTVAEKLQAISRQMQTVMVVIPPQFTIGVATQQSLRVPVNSPYRIICEPLETGTDNYV